jgi:hypothetical protein
MADAKISELSNLTGANLASSDEFVVNDGNSTTVAITAAELINFIKLNPLFDVEIVTITDAAYVPNATFQAIILNHASVDVDLTFDNVLPVGSVLVLYSADGGSSGHTVTLADAQEFDDSGNNVATFDVAGDYGIWLALSATRLLKLADDGIVYS